MSQASDNYLVDYHDFMGEVCGADSWVVAHSPSRVITVLPPNALPVISWLGWDVLEAVPRKSIQISSSSFGFVCISLVTGSPNFSMSLSAELPSAQEEPPTQYS